MCVCEEGAVTTWRESTPVTSRRQSGSCWFSPLHVGPELRHTRVPDRPTVLLRDHGLWLQWRPMANAFALAIGREELLVYSFRLCSSSSCTVSPSLRTLVQGFCHRRADSDAGSTAASRVHCHRSTTSFFQSQTGVPTAACGTKFDHGALAVGYGTGLLTGVLETMHDHDVVAVGRDTILLVKTGVPTC